MTILPTPYQLAQALLRLLKDLGFWRPARPEPVPVPDDGEFTKIEQVRNQAVAWFPEPAKAQYINQLYAHASGTPRLQLP